MWRWTALLGLSVLTFVVGLGRPAIQDADEAFYAESGREMIVSGDWITPHFNDEPRVNKPILFYWLVALDYRTTGVGETAARLWSALAGVGLAMAAAGVARRWVGPGPDLLAGGIVATSLGLTRIARTALPDVPLACFVTIAIWALLEVFRTDAQASHPRRWLWLAAVATGLAFLTKGPVAVVLLGVVVPPAVWLEWRRNRGRATWPIGGIDILVAIAIVAAIATPWFILATAANGRDFLRNFFLGENVDRFLTDRFNQSQPVWYYGGVIVAGLLPWTPFFAMLVRPLARVLRTRTISDAGVRLAIWSIAPLLFFTASTGKQPRYILPCLVPIGVLLAREIWRRTAAGRRDTLVTALGVTTGVMVITVALLTARLAPLFRLADASWTMAGPVLIGLAGLAFVAGSFVARETMRTLVWITAAAILAVTIEASIFWRARPEAVERVAARLVEAGAVDRPGSDVSVCACGAFARNLGYYAHVRTIVSDSEADVRTFLTSSAIHFAVVDEPTLNRLEAELGRRFDRLLTVPYLDTARLRLLDLLRDPDPLRVPAVVLVRTQ